jgi:hypothetical protein
MSYLLVHGSGLNVSSEPRTTKRMPGHRVGRFWKFKTAEVDERVRAGGAATVAASDPDEGDPR